MEADIPGVENDRSDLKEGVIKIALSEVAFVGVNLLNRGRIIDRNAVGCNSDEIAMLEVEIHDSCGTPSTSTLFSEPKRR